MEYNCGESKCFIGMDFSTDLKEALVSSSISLLNATQKYGGVEYANSTNENEGKESEEDIVDVLSREIQRIPEYSGSETHTKKELTNIVKLLIDDVVKKRAEQHLTIQEAKHVCTLSSGIYNLFGMEDLNNMEILERQIRVFVTNAMQAIAFLGKHQRQERDILKMLLDPTFSTESLFSEGEESNTIDLMQKLLRSNCKYNKIVKKYPELMREIKNCFLREELLQRKNDMLESCIYMMNNKGIDLEFENNELQIRNSILEEEKNNMLGSIDLWPDVLPETDRDSSDQCEGTKKRLSETIKGSCSLSDLKDKTESALKVIKHGNNKEVTFAGEQMKKEFVKVLEKIRSGYKDLLKNEVLEKRKWKAMYEEIVLKLTEANIADNPGIKEFPFLSKSKKFVAPVKMNVSTQTYWFDV